MYCLESDVESGKGFRGLYSILDFASTNHTFGIKNVGSCELFGITTRGYSHFRTVVLTNLDNSTSAGTSLSLDGSIGVASDKRRDNCGNCCFRERMHDKLEGKPLDGAWYIYI